MQTIVSSCSVINIIVDNGLFFFCSQHFVACMNSSILNKQNLTVTPSSSSKNIQQYSDIFKLDTDCHEAYFDYLPLENLATFGKTCISFCNLAGQFFYHNFVTTFFCKNGSISPQFYDFDVNINCFSPFIRNILMLDGNLSVFQSHNFTSLKSIEFYYGTISSTKYIQKILRNVKTLKFLQSKIDGNVYNIFFKFCKNLKHLYVKDNYSFGMKRGTIIGTSNQWLTKIYSKLKHFEIDCQQKNDLIIQFLNNNKKIQHFSTNIEFLINNMELIMKSEIKLNVLSILHAETDIDENEFQTILKDFLLLKKRQFFKYLHLYFASNERAYVYPTDLLSCVKVLHIEYDYRMYALASMGNLERLYVKNISQISDFDTALNQLTKLNYIFIETVNDILQLIRNLPKLKQIEIFYVHNGKLFNEETDMLNLSTLNDERKMVKNPCKLTIYVSEKIYLATKSAANAKQPTFDLVEIKRIESKAERLDFCFK